jgi:hypothetical protein
MATDPDQERLQTAGDQPSNGRQRAAAARTRVLEALRQRLLRLWQAKGGGFYGFGFIVTFAILETRAATGEFAGSDSLSSYIVMQALAFVIRFSLQSFVNGLVAAIWPVYLMFKIGWWALAVLVVGQGIFATTVRPLVERWLPELRKTPKDAQGPASDSEPV